MNQEDEKEILASLKGYVKETTSTADKALAVLVEAGLVKENGQPEEPYQD